MVALAKASSLVAAAVGGLAAGVDIYLSGSLNASVPRQDEVTAAVTLAAAVLLACAALYLSSAAAFRIPPAATRTTNHPPYANPTALRERNPMILVCQDELAGPACERSEAPAALATCGPHAIAAWFPSCPKAECSDVPPPQSQQSFCYTRKLFRIYPTITLPPLPLPELPGLALDGEARPRSQPTYSARNAPFARFGADRDGYRVQLPPVRRGVTAHDQREPGTRR